VKQKLLFLLLLLPIMLVAQIRDHQLQPGQPGQVRGTDATGVSTSFFPEVLPAGLGSYNTDDIVNVGGRLYRDTASVTITTDPPGEGWVEIGIQAIPTGLPDVFNGLQSPNLNFSAINDSVRAGAPFSVYILGDSRVELGFTPTGFARILARDFGWHGCSFPIGSAFEQFKFFDRQTGGGGTGINDQIGNAVLSTNGLSRVFTAGDAYTITSSPGDSLAHYERVRLYYLRPATAATMRITVDGIPTDFVLPVSASNEVGFIEVVGLKDEGHTLTISHVSGAQVDAFELQFNRGNRGAFLAAGGNNGIKVSEQANYVGNTYFLNDLRPDLMIFRLGVNDLIDDQINTTADQLRQVIDAYKVFANGVAVIGETDNQLNYPGSITGYNGLIETLARDSAYAWVNMYDYIPDWQAFRDQGPEYSDDPVHADSIGGFFVARSILNGFGNQVSSGGGVTRVAAGPNIGVDNSDPGVPIIFEDNPDLDLQAGGNDPAKFGVRIGTGNNNTQSTAGATPAAIFAFTDFGGYSWQHWIYSKHTGNGNGLYFVLNDTNRGDDANSLGTQEILSLKSLANEGRVGVNNFDPQANFHVNGNGLFSGPVQGAPATNDNEYVTRGQLNAAVAGGGGNTDLSVSSTELESSTGTNVALSDINSTVYEIVSLNSSTTFSPTADEPTFVQLDGTSIDSFRIGNGAFDGQFLVVAAYYRDTLVSLNTPASFTVPNQVATTTQILLERGESVSLVWFSGTWFVVPGEGEKDVSGTIDATTDASGDLTVIHGLGSTPEFIDLGGPWGTTIYNAQPHAVSPVSFKIRVADVDGLPVAATQVKVSWTVK